MPPTKPAPKKAAVRAKSSRPAVESSVSFLIPLNNGAGAYVLYPRGRTVRVRTSSQEFFDLVSQITQAGYGGPLRAELDGFARRWPTSHWPAVRASIDGAAS